MAAVLFALLPAAPACGGGGDAPTEPPPPPSPPPRVQTHPQGVLGITTGTIVHVAASVVSATGQPVAGHVVRWQSLDTTVATVTQAGVATGVRPGSARLVASSTGAFPDTLDLLVSARVTATTLQTRSRLLTGIGEVVRLEARSQAGAAEHPGTYTWLSRDPAVATVDGGTVTARGLGTTWIVVHEAHGTADSARIRVADVRFSSWPTGEFNSAPIFEPLRPLLHVSEPLDEDLVVRLVSSDSSVAAPVADSVVIARGDTSVRVYFRVGREGTATVEARAVGIPTFGFTITSAQPRIRHEYMSTVPGGYQMSVGDETQLLATFVTVADPPRISARTLLEERVITAVSTDTTVVRVLQPTLRIPAGEAFVPFGEWGIARAVGPGTATVRFTTPGALPDSLPPITVRP